MPRGTTTSSSATAARTEPRRILVCAPTWVGDVLMATPALRALRRAHPKAEIAVSGPRWLPDLLICQNSFRNVSVSRHEVGGHSDYLQT